MNYCRRVSGSSLQRTEGKVWWTRGELFGVRAHARLTRCCVQGASLPAGIAAAGGSEPAGPAHAHGRINATERHDGRRNRPDACKPKQGSRWSEWHVSTAALLTVQCQWRCTSTAGGRNAGQRTVSRDEAARHRVVERLAVLVVGIPERGGRWRGRGGWCASDSFRPARPRQAGRCLAPSPGGKHAGSEQAACNHASPPRGPHFQ